MDDKVLLGESREELNGGLSLGDGPYKHIASAWVEAREYMECNFSKRRSISNLEVKGGDHIIPQVTWFKYLGVHNTKRWRKRSKCKPLNTSKVVEMEEYLMCSMWYVSSTLVEGNTLSDNFKTDDVVWDGVLGCRKQHENRRNIAGNRMLRWMCFNTWRLVGVAPIVENMVETRIRWFGHVEPVDFVVRRVDVVWTCRTCGFCS